MEFDWLWRNMSFFLCVNICYISRGKHSGVALGPGRSLPVSASEMSLLAGRYSWQIRNDFATIHPAAGGKDTHDASETCHLMGTIAR